MGIALVLIVLALVLGGVGFLVEGLVWLLVIALALALVGALVGGRARGARA